MRLRHPYLSKRHSDDRNTLTKICESWEMTEEEFVRKIDHWFDNFKISDYDLAFKILSEIDYYSKTRYRKTLDGIFKQIEREYSSFRREVKNDIILLVPDEYGDSAHVHAYELTKSWNISSSQIVSVSQLSEKQLAPHSIIVAFNDTYGSGKQFVTQMFSNEKVSIILEKHSVFAVGITITSTARSYITHCLPNAKILPETSPKTAYDTFNHAEMRRIEILGRDVYPPHPLGFGSAGLLVAYDFQCPNNSIPLIWANSEVNNNEFENYSYPWNPLFEYRQKTKNSDGSEKVKENKPKNKFIGDTQLKLTESEICEINNILDNWQCSRPDHKKIVSRLTKWFDNFEDDNKDLALRIFRNISYMSLSRTRTEIRNLRDKVFSQITTCRDDKSNMILVLTGYEIESSYHYVYDFMRIWGLQISQVLTLEHLIKHPYEAVGKHLVFFYHTRIHKQETFIHEIWPEAQKLPARFFHVLSFLMSELTANIFEGLKRGCPKKNMEYYYCESISRPLKNIFSENELLDLGELLKKKSVKSTSIKDSFLVSYYFNCPKNTLSLLWSGRKINPLFLSK